MSELKPCPFCGKENTVAGSTERMILGWWYACEDCFENRKGGVHEDRWNTRPIEDELNRRIAELEADNNRLKCSNDTQTQTFVYGKESKEESER